MFERFLRVQMKYSKLLLVFLLGIIALSAYIATDLKIDPDFGRLVSQDSEYNTNDRIISSSFSQNDAVLVLISQDRDTLIKNPINDMSDEEISQYVQVLSDTFKESSYVVGVSEAEVSDDKRYIRFTVALQVPENIGSFALVLDELNELSNEAGSPPGIKTTITGLPVLLDKVSTLLISDNLRTIFITLGFIFAILFWYSRSIVFTFITMATPVVSLVFLGALMVVLEIPVTITLAAVGVLVLGLGADYGIHISVHYLRAKRHHESHEDALLHTIEQLRLPITASFITTLAGFAALILGVSPSSQAQGMVLALGIAVIYATTFILFPIVMTVLYSKVSVRPNFIFDKVLTFLGELGVFQTKYSKTVLFLILIITGVMMYGMTKVEFSTSNSNWIPDDDPVSQSFNEINYAYGNEERIYLVLKSTKGDLRDVQTKRDVDKVIALLEGIPNVERVVSAYDDLSYDTNEVFDALTHTQRRNSFNRDFTLTTISIETQNLKQDEAGDSVVLKDVREITSMYVIHNAEVSLFGDPVRFEELGDSLEKDAGVTTLVGLSLVFFVASAVYASLSVGFLALIPIIIALIWAIGLMGYFGVPFTSLSTGIVSLVLGVGVDFSIHLVDGIRKMLNKAASIRDAVVATMTSSGNAIFLSSLTTFVGFLALTFANLLGTQRLGWSLAFSILSVFIVSMTFVPALMSILHKRKHKKHKK